MPHYLPISIPLSCSKSPTLLFFFFNPTATTEIYTLSLHDALPIYAWVEGHPGRFRAASRQENDSGVEDPRRNHFRSEEHTSELQSHSDLVCRLLLEKKNASDATAIFADLGRDFDLVRAEYCLALSH